MPNTCKNQHTELLLHITEVSKSSWAQSNSLLFSLHPSNEKVGVFLQQLLTKLLEKFVSFNTNELQQLQFNQTSVQRHTSYFLFIAPLSFQRFEKAATIKSISLTFLLLFNSSSGTDKGFSRPSCRTLMFSPWVPTFSSAGGRESRSSKHVKIYNLMYLNCWSA